MGGFPKCRDAPRGRPGWGGSGLPKRANVRTRATMKAPSHPSPTPAPTDILGNDVFQWLSPTPQGDENDPPGPFLCMFWEMMYFNGSPPHPRATARVPAHPLHYPRPYNDHENDPPGPFLRTSWETSGFNGSTRILNWLLNRRAISEMIDCIGLLIRRK